MLPADLLMQRYQGEEVIPKRLLCSADNLAIAHNVIRGAYDHGVEKLMFLASSCIYPKFAP